MVKEVYDIVRKAGGTKKNYDSKDTTPIETVKDCLSFIKFEPDDIVADAGSGKEKVWFNEIPVKNKMAFELMEGEDFLKYDKPLDWVVGNPPFHEWLEFMFHSSKICRKGFCFLINHTRLNQLTTKRLWLLEQEGFYLNCFRIVDVKKWFGRYYFLVFTREKSKVISYSYKGRDRHDNKQ